MAGLLEQYNGMRLSDSPINRQPKTRGLLNMLVDNPKTLAGLIAHFTPVVGDVKSAYDSFDSARHGNYGEAALNALGLLPFIPSIGGVMRKGDWVPGDDVSDLISSQKYLDRDTVAKKIRDRDFAVKVSPRFNLDGEAVRAIQDGHHALEAAKRSRNAPTIIEQSAKDNDRIGLLEKGSIDDFLQASYMDSSWRKWINDVELF